MTSDEAVAWLESLPSETISPSVLAVVAGGDPYSYNICAKNGKLDIPHFWRGRNLRIWKGPVIKMIEGDWGVQTTASEQTVSRHEAQMP